MREWSFFRCAKRLCCVFGCRLLNSVWITNKMKIDAKALCYKIGTLYLVWQAFDVKIVPYLCTPLCTLLCAYWIASHAIYTIYICIYFRKRGNPNGKLCKTLFNFNKLFMMLKLLTITLHLNVKRDDHSTWRKLPLVLSQTDRFSWKVVIFFHN